MRTGPPPSRTAAVATGFAYTVAAVATISVTRFGGGVAYLWVAGAVLVSALLARPRTDWPWLLLTCGIGGALATSVVGVGPAGALPLVAVNLSEALGAALLLRRLGSTSDPLDSVGRLARLVLAVGVVAPVATAPLGAAVVAVATGTSFTTNLVA